MTDVQGYPENRLDIRIDEQGNMIYQPNPEFVKAYAPTREEKEEELEELRYRLELLLIDEPSDSFGYEYEEWEEEKQLLEDEIEELEDEISGKSP